MMGLQENQKDMFSYAVDLDKRVRLDNPFVTRVCDVFVIAHFQHMV